MPDSAAVIPPTIRFIALEGVDGSGKSTQASLLAAWCREQGEEVVLTREPGGTALTERLRAILLDPDVTCTPRAELLLLLAARAEHVAEVIAPALQAGTVVITDRFALSSLAYQGAGRGLPLDEIRDANAVATGGLTPDLTFVIDVPLDTALARVGAKRDRFEQEGRDFWQRVIDGYHALAAGDPSIHMLDGMQPIDTIQRSIRDLIRRAGSAPAPEGAHS